MKIKLNLDEFYRLMREREIETIRQLGNESGVPEGALYCAVRMILSIILDTFFKNLFKAETE